MQLKTGYSLTGDRLHYVEVYGEKVSLSMCNAVLFMELKTDGSCRRTGILCRKCKRLAANKNTHSTST